MTTTPTLPSQSPWVDRGAALIPPGGTVLDIACGTGRHTDLLVIAGYQVTAIDRDTSRLIPRTGIEIVETDLRAPIPGPCTAGPSTESLWPTI